MTDATASGEQANPPAQAPRFFLRVSLVFAGWTLLHMGILAALLWTLIPWWSAPAAYVLMLGAIAVLLRNFREDAYPSRWTRLLVVRPFWYAQVSLFFLSAVGTLGFLVGLPFGHAVLWARWALAGEAALLLLSFVVGYIGSRALVVKRVSFAFADLPASFDGVTIAQLSDLHVGPHTPGGYLRRIVRSVEDAKPDLIAFTGDQVDDYDQDVARFAEVFGGLRAPLGVYAIAGNHDVYAGWPGVRDGMLGAGMRVLVNDAEPIRRDADALWIVGTGDPAGAQGRVPGGDEAAPDLEKSMAKVPPGGFTLVLAHNPALWPHLVARGGARMTLSGHTHHGQLSIPFLNWCLATPFLGEVAMGAPRRGDAQLYINPGTNYWALPFRIGAWPEVTLVTLRRDALDASG